MTLPRMTTSTQLVLEVLLSDPDAEWLYGLEIGDAAGLRSGTVHPILARFEGLWLGLSSRWEEIDPSGDRKTCSALLPFDGRGGREHARSCPVSGVASEAPRHTSRGGVVRGAPRATAAFLVRSATRTLPKGGARERYRSELQAELQSLPRGHVSLATPSESPPVRGRYVAHSPSPGPRPRHSLHKPLHCRLHLWHHYRQVSTEDGQRYRCCVERHQDHTGEIDIEGESAIGRGRFPLLLVRSSPH